MIRFFCTILIAAITISAAGKDITFSTLSANDGLSQNTVLSIGEDRLGNLWFATFNGLNRYDGYGFKVFRHDNDDPASIGSNTVRTLFFDSKGTIWAGTTKGLSRYDMQMETFSNYPTPEGRVTDIEEISPELFMVGTDGGLKIFDTAQDCFAPDMVPEHMSYITVHSLCRSGDKIYIGTGGRGLFTYSVTGHDFRRISAFKSSGPINVILKDRSSDCLWIGTEGDGLFLFDPATLSVQKWSHGKSGNKSLCSNHIRSLAYDSEGRLWIGTFGGLNIYDPSSGKISTFTNNPFNQGTIAQNSIRSIYRDTQNGMWLGTYFGGISYWNPLKNRFSHIKRSQEGKSLNDNIVSCIVEDSDGTLWIGTNTGGVNHYNPTTERFSYYPLQAATPADIESNDIKSIYIAQGTPYIYIGAHAGGLNVLDRRTGHIRHFNTPPADVYSILRKDSRHLWVGTLDGLYTFDTFTGTFSRETADAEGKEITPRIIRDIFIDSAGDIWLGGEDGLSAYRQTPQGLTNIFKGREHRQAKDIPGPDNSFIQCIFESAAHIIWTGTRDGLYGYDKKAATSGSTEFRHYTTADGLQSNIIHGIEEDSHGRLWLSTDNGLSCFNPYSGTFRNFTARDGLQSNQFNTYAHCKTTEGEMYFGGINGITVFTPEQLEDNPYTPQPILTGLHVFNDDITPGDDTGILKESISTVKSISLKPVHNHFAIDFVVPNFLAGENNTFAYMLEGFDKDWTVTSDRHSAAYTNLTPGTYRFLVKAANNDGKWNSSPTSLDIRILPRWYQTIAAIIIFAILITGILIAIAIVLLERKNMENRLLLEKQEKAHQEELSQMKIRFFINISHELRTPLTLIVNPLQEMAAKATDPWMRKQLKYVERNSLRLLNLVNQLMDYRRAELGVFKLSVKLENVHRIVWENWSYYENLAKNKKLKYTLHSDIEGRSFYVDSMYLELILNNLLSNSFKFTKQGSIDVRLTEKGGKLLLTVADTGCGIPKESKDRIFERFYQIENSHIGSGIGLSLVQSLVSLHHGEISLESEEGKGSAFTISIPQDTSAYSEEELSERRSETHTTNSQDMYTVDTEDYQEEEPAASGNYIKRGTIMIVEDNDEVRTYLHNGLSRLFDIIQASNGTEALKLIKDRKVDLVITDLVMPEMGGARLCMAIKQNSDTSHIPVIIISAQADNDEQLEALKNGADDFITKPFSMKALVTKIQNMMRTQTRLYDKATKTLEVIPEKVTFNPVDEDFLVRAVAIIEKNMDNAEFSTDEFARAMNMSRSNLHLRLKAITGESALEFIHKVRFREACKLLREGKHTIAEISDRVGFSTPSYFATCFKKYMGCIPSEYIQNRHSEQ